ncbi:MAG TPA: LD-carboxypeptidase, partial [Rhodothermales bacterium]|nr:LD-carboxypeptidase [Rhodothermales bacterium]
MPRLNLNRRLFLQRAGLASLALPAFSAAPSAIRTAKTPLPIRKPPRLRRGDIVGLISPGGLISNPFDVSDAEETLAGLGLRTRRGRHVLDHRGYLGGTDAERASDVNRMFADPNVKAIIAMRGGWGCSRILPLLNYNLIRAHPKILCGYSDVTSLLVGIYAKSGIVTFHGPVGISTWNDFTIDYFVRTLFDGERLRMETPPPPPRLFASFRGPS